MKGIPLICSKGVTGPMAPPYFGCGFRNIIPRSGIIVMQIVIKTLLRACEARSALQREDQDCSFSLS